jgi:hypothetical protein
MAKKRRKAKRPAENRENTARKPEPNRKIKLATAALGPSAPERERLEVISFFRARQKLREQAANDRAQRYKEFLAGIRNPNEPPLAGRTLLPSAGKRSLRILAEGDSWFEYPLPVAHGDGVIYQLEQLLGYPIANMAHHGLEVEQMMGLSIRQEIIAKLSDPQVKFDALLFSGGGMTLSATNSASG